MENTDKKRLWQYIIYSCVSINVPEVSDFNLYIFCQPWKSMQYKNELQKAESYHNAFLPNSKAKRNKNICFNSLQNLIWL